MMDAPVNIKTEPTMTNGSAQLPPNSLWRVSVGTYHAMIEAGILTDDDPIELLQGWMVKKMPKKPRHSVLTRLLFDLLTRLLSAGWYVSSQEPITTADSEPEPDLSVVAGSPHDYLHHHPQPADVALVVEVSDATLSRDQGIKKRLYAAAAIPVYWIINLPDNQVEVYSQPFVGVMGADYRQQQTYLVGDNVPVVIAGEEKGSLSVAEILLV